jgi:hypothetical protein
MSIYIAKEGKNWGPYESKQVSVLVERGSFEENDWAWIEGSSEWVPVREILATLDDEKKAESQMLHQKLEVTKDRWRSKLTQPTPLVFHEERSRNARSTHKVAAAAVNGGALGRNVFCGVLGVGLAGLIALLVLRPAAVADYNLLQTREGLAYAPDTSEPFEGKAVSHHPNGQLMFKAEYHAGRQHGELVSFFADGQKQSEGTLVDGLFHGKVIYYHSNGEVQSHYVYQNGEAISRKNWDAAGNMVNRGQ